MYGNFPQFRDLKKKLVVNSIVNKTTNNNPKTQKSSKQLVLIGQGSVSQRITLGDSQGSKGRCFLMLSKNKKEFCKNYYKIYVTFCQKKTY
jgi:hypothetical protein